MPGFFRDTSGLDNNDNGLSTNNAAADFGRSGAAPSDLFSRLFGRRNQGITSQPLPSPGGVPESPPAISSGDALVGRILQSSAPPPPPQEQPYNPTPMQGPQSVMRQPQPQPFHPSMLRTQPVDQPQPLPAYRGIPRFPQPPASQFASDKNVGGDILQSILNLVSSLSGSGRPGGSDGFLGQGGLPAPPRVGGGMSGQGGMPGPLPRQGGGIFGMGGLPQTRGFFSGGPTGFARGGFPPLMGGLPERHARGSYVEPDGQGDGRSDHIKAVLSPGEFVQDAETVSLLGNGDNDAGARGMEAIRQEIRKHKGKALSKGKFSPNAQSPAKLAKIGVKAAARGGR